MRPIFRWTPCLLFAACGGATAPAVAPLAFTLPESTVVLDGASGDPIGTPELFRRLAAADFVLLGEVHDNAIHHVLRGALIRTAAPRRPAVVFEQFGETGAPIHPPLAGEDPEGWLDRNGFDRRSWRWPLHQPVVEAALGHGRSLWGSGLSREALRSVVREGEAAAPEQLRLLLERSPLDSVARALVDRALIEGHCGQLAPPMVPGMRAAQTVRDAAMTRGLLLAGDTGPAWLIAGNGHVRRDVGVPRLLRAARPASTMLVVGFLEREADGAVRDPARDGMFDLVIVTPRAAREDPCASLSPPTG